MVCWEGLFDVLVGGSVLEGLVGGSVLHGLADGSVLGWVGGWVCTG